MPRRAVVTGANGFLGSAVAAALEDDGWDVVRCARQPPLLARGGWRSYDLAWRSLPGDFFDGVQLLVHAAFVAIGTNANSFWLNVNGSELLLCSARDAGVRTMFISSLAARSDARSDYGRQKYAIETMMDADAGAIVRPGLILGDGGVFGRLLHHVKAGRPVPLVDGGRQPLQTVLLEDLIVALCSVASADVPGRFVLAETPAVEYRTFFRALAEKARVAPRFVTVPSWALLSVANIARISGIRSPVDRDNVLGLLGMRYVEPTKDAPLSLPRIRQYTESLDALFKAGAEIAHARQKKT